MSTSIFLDRIHFCRIAAILLIIVSVPITKSCAQNLKSKLYMSAIIEKTILEKQAGGGIYLQLPSLWRIGGFYQTTFDNKVEGTTGGTFWGALLAVPLVKAKKMNFYFNARAGLVDNIFFVATPGVTTEIKISRHLGVDIGMSLRKGYLSANTNLNFRL